MTDYKSKIKELESRIQKLEKVVFKTFTAGKKTSKKSDKSYDGLTGGITLLINNGFFKKPVLVTEVQDELQREGYFYSIQATDTLLRRNMVKSKKILTRIQIDGIWQYVIRK